MNNEACDIISKLPADVIFYMLEMDISGHQSISQILRIANNYDQCFGENRRTKNFYNDGGWKIILKAIGRIILLHAPRSLHYGELEEGFIPISPLPGDSKHFYPSKLFDIIPSLFDGEFKVFDSWNKYRLAWAIDDKRLCLLENNSKYYFLETEFYFAHSTLYFVYIEENELKIFLDKPWIDAYAIFRMKINNIHPDRDLEIQLKETIDGLMLIFHEVKYRQNMEYAYETIYKINLVKKTSEIIYESQRYIAHYVDDFYEERIAYNYGSSMVLLVGIESNESNMNNYDSHLQSYDGIMHYPLNEERQITGLETTGLVGYDVISTVDSRFLIDENGDYIRDIPSKNSYIFLNYFESFYVTMSKMNKGRIEVVDLITGEILSSNASESKKAFITRKDNKEGYFIWLHDE